MSLPGGEEKVGNVSRPDVDRDQSFPREFRLTARRQFLKVYNSGRRRRSTLLTVFGYPNTVGHCRLGITVTRKVGCAVTRNRIKRLLREVFRRNRHELNAGLDLVVNAHPAIVGGSLQQIEKEFLNCCGRLTGSFRR